MTDQIDITPLVNAHNRLAEGLTRYLADTSDAQIRDGLIQRFEFTYEISHKILKRYLEQVSASPETIDSLAFGDLIRTANEQGLLLHDWTAWKGYREMRSKTSHTYNEHTALEVVAGIGDFLLEVEFLVKRLNQRIRP